MLKQATQHTYNQTLYTVDTFHQPFAACFSPLFWASTMWSCCLSFPHCCSSWGVRFFSLRYFFFQAFSAVQNRRVTRSANHAGMPVWLFWRCLWDFTCSTFASLTNLVWSCSRWKLPTNTNHKIQLIKTIRANVQSTYTVIVGELVVVPWADPLSTHTYTNTAKGVFP